MYLIDCMVLNAVFNVILVISRQPVHLSTRFWSSFNQCHNILSNQPNVSNVTIVETIDSGERGMIPVAMSSMRKHRPRRTISEVRTKLCAMLCERVI